MDPRIEAALIAGAVSIAGALISYLVSKSKIRAELEKLRLQQKHTFIEKLCELRLEAYPEVIEITQSIGKKGHYSDEEIINITNEAREKLRVWRNTKASLLLSKDSLDAYYRLKEVIYKKPAHSSSYTNEQLQKIWTARNDFRRCLQSDIGVIHEE